MSGFGSVWGSLPAPTVNGVPTSQSGNAAPFSAAWYAAQGMTTNGQPIPKGGGPVYTYAGGGTQTVGTYGANGASANGSMTPAQTIQNIIQNGTNAVPASLTALGSQSTNTMTSTAGVDQPIQNASDQTAQFIQNLIQGGTGTGGQAATNAVTQMLQGSGPTSTATAAMEGALAPTNTNYLQSGAAPVSAAQLSTANINQYLDPNLQSEEAATEFTGQEQDNAIRAREAKSGAFGGNSAVSQAVQDELTQQTVAQEQEQGYQSAIGEATTDVGAQNAAAQANRAAVQNVNSQTLGAQLTDAQRALTGGQALNSTALATQGQDYSQYLQSIGLGASLGQAASSSLGALPGTKTLSTDQLGPSAAGQEIGALIGLTGLEQQYSQPQGGGGVSFSNTGTPAAGAGAAGGAGSTGLSNASLQQLIAALSGQSGTGT